MSAGIGLVIDPRTLLTPPLPSHADYPGFVAHAPILLAFFFFFFFVLFFGWLFYLSVYARGDLITHSPKPCPFLHNQASPVLLLRSDRSAFGIVNFEVRFEGGKVGNLNAELELRSVSEWFYSQI